MYYKKIIYVIILVIFSSQVFADSWRPNQVGSFLSSKIARSMTDIENSAYFAEYTYNRNPDSFALGAIALEALIANGQRVMVTCPPTVKPGQKIRFQLPVQLSNDQLAAIKVSYDKDGWMRCLGQDLKFHWVYNSSAASEEEAKKRHESDAWIELIHKYLPYRCELSIREAFEGCFPQNNADDCPIDLQKITRQDQRRMGKCLIAAGWIRDGKFNKGERRNQARFILVGNAHDDRK